MSTEIYSLVESKIMTDDIQAFKAQAKKMKDATEDEIGTISYDFFIDEERREVFIVEKYASPKLHFFNSFFFILCNSFYKFCFYR